MPFRRKTELRALADEELMPLVAGKEIAAFEVFYDRHERAAYSLAHRITGDRDLAEDVVQEAFLSIWRSRAGHDLARGSVRTWILGTVRNRAIDAIRRDSAKKVPPLDPRGDDALADRATADATEGEALRRETSRELRGLMSELPAEQGQVVELAYFGGFSHSEIAQMLDLSMGTVKGRMRLALEKIRLALDDGVLR